MAITCGLEELEAMSPGVFLPEATAKCSPCLWVGEVPASALVRFSGTPRVWLRRSRGLGWLAAIVYHFTLRSSRNEQCIIPDLEEKGV